MGINPQEKHMTKYIEYHGPLNQTYLTRIESTTDKAIAEFSRAIAIRFDLRSPSDIDPDSPQYFFNADASVISRFFDHLNVNIKADLAKRKRTKGAPRAYRDRLRYAWAREQHQGDRPHYHILILLNNDNYKRLGNYNIAENHDNLASKIQEAWCSALGLPVEEFWYLVHFPDHCVYYLNSNREKDEFDKDRDELIYRASYLAKKKTKHYGNGYRSFGCSQY